MWDALRKRFSHEDEPRSSDQEAGAAPTPAVPAAPASPLPQGQSAGLDPAVNEDTLPIVAANQTTTPITAANQDTLRDGNFSSPSAPSSLGKPSVELADSAPLSQTQAPMEEVGGALSAPPGAALPGGAREGDANVLDATRAPAAAPLITADAYRLDPSANKLDAIAALAEQDGAPPASQADRPWGQTAPLSSTVAQAPPEKLPQDGASAESAGAHEDAAANVQEATEELMVRAVVADQPSSITALTATEPVVDTTGEGNRAQVVGQDTFTTATVQSIETDTDVPITPGDAASAEPLTPGVALAPVAPLTPGVVVGERYTIVAPGADDGALRTFQATDARGYEHCWSCGSTANGPQTRFCQSCGAPVQNHPVTLIESPAPTGRQGEITYGTVFLYPRPERRLFGGGGVDIEVGAYSAEGPHHPNEDSYWRQTQVVSANSERRGTAVVLLCDGMGGYAPGSGLISSRIAEIAGTTIANALAQTAGVGQTLAADDLERIVRAGIAAANKMVVNEIVRSGDMGSTLIAAVVYGDTAYIANVGDSRAYYIDPQGGATVVTHDQSLVGQAVQEGRLAEKDMYDAPGANIILHAIGEREVQNVADWYVQPLEPGGRIVLCSDGYWKTMRGVVKPAPSGTEGAAVNVLFRAETLSAVAARMVEDALMQGSDDNTTVVLIAVG